MRSRQAIVCIILCVAASTLQAQEQPYAVILSSSLTTSSTFYYNPGDPEQTLRGLNHTMNSVSGYGIELRRVIEPGRIWIGLSTEFISKQESFTIPRDASTSIPVKNGYTAIPVELTGYFVIPFSGDVFRLYMGGGGGLYWGDRTYEKADVRAQTTERHLGYGIHILSGLEYSFSRPVALRGEVRFRNIQFDVISRMPQDYTTYQGKIIPLDRGAFASRILIDGMVVNLGLVLRFSTSSGTK